jgi:hypothetical protein
MAYQADDVDPNNMADMPFLQSGAYGPTLALIQELLNKAEPLGPSITAHTDQGNYWQQRATGQPKGSTPEEREAHMQLLSVYQARSEACYKKAQYELGTFCKIMVLYYAVQGSFSSGTWQVHPQLISWLRAPIRGPADVQYAQHLLELAQAGEFLPGAVFVQQVAA